MAEIRSHGGDPAQIPHHGSTAPQPSRIIAPPAGSTLLPVRGACRRAVRLLGRLRIGLSVVSFPSQSLLCYAACIREAFLFFSDIELLHSVQAEEF